MSYIGNPIVSTDFPKDTFSGNGSTTAFTMQIAPASVNSVIVVVSGITQDPSTYTISGTTLTFSAAPPTGTSNISVRHLGVAGIPNTPSDASVTTAKLATGGPYWDSSGNVGVGTTTPRDVSGYVSLALNDTTGGLVDFYAAGTRVGTISGNSSNMSLSTVTAVPMVFSTNTNEAMRLTSAGNLTVGSATGHAYAPPLTLSKSASYLWGLGPLSGTPQSFFVMNTSGTGVYLADGGTSWTANSDERLKTQLIPFENALNKVCTLRAGTGRYLTDAESVSRSFLIAQDVQAILPEAVNVQQDEIGTLGLQYTDVIPLLVASIKELNAKVDAQAVEIAALKGTV